MSVTFTFNEYSPGSENLQIKVEVFLICTTGLSNRFSVQIHSFLDSIFETAANIGWCNGITSPSGPVFRLERLNVFWSRLEGKNPVTVAVGSVVDENSI